MNLYPSVLFLFSSYKFVETIFKMKPNTLVTIYTCTDILNFQLFTYHLSSAVPNATLKKIQWSENKEIHMKGRGE